ncbi:WD40 repeat [Trinorchestia longiramus]|nr:WD40 repeat [Trinorchestia longiramus]
MSLICAICNEVPEHAVVSPVSGGIFERRLIEKFIAEHGIDPINNKDLSTDQLIEIKVSPVVKPKPPSATSIPAILKALQDEWDSVMLHSFSLRQQLHTAKQELSHALYQHDAATRVIARLTKEVTAAREALATLKPQAGIQPQTPTHGVATGEAGLSEAVVARLQSTATTLTQERKRRGRSVPEGLTPPDQIRAFTTRASHPGLHSASVPGILSLDVHQKDTSKVVTGGADKNATVFNKDTEQVVAILKGHSKKVTCVVYHPTEDTIVTASPDTQIRVWNVGTSQTLQLISAHDGPVTGLSLHATGDYLLSASLDHHWAFSDIRTGRVLCKVSDQSNSSALTAAQFHPDGLILGTGTQDATIKIWDLKERSNVANFPGHSGAISSIAFSENGYYLATAAEDSTVRLWDLRKLRNFKTLQLDEGYEVTDLCFDRSGTYLAVAGSDVRVYLCKQWTDLRVFTDHTALATGVRFAADAASLASTSMDRTLKIYGS